MSYTAEIFRDGQLVAKLERARPYTAADAADWPGCVLVADGVEYPAPDPPAPDLLQNIQENLASATKIAEAKILSLKSKAALMLGMGGMPEADVNAAGSALVVQHSGLIQAYILAGGNPVARQALLDAINETPPQWWNDEFAAMFAAELA